MTDELRLFSQASLGLELFKRNARKSISWQTFLEASEAVLIGSPTGRARRAKASPHHQRYGSWRHIFLGDSESSTTSQQFPLTLIVIPRRAAAADAH